MLSSYEMTVVQRFVDAFDAGRTEYPPEQLEELADVLFRLLLAEQKSRETSIGKFRASPRLRRAVQAAGLQLDDDATVEDGLNALVTLEAKIQKRKASRIHRQQSLRL